jgi:hypothetical protein
MQFAAQNPIECTYQCEHGVPHLSKCVLFYKPKVDKKMRIVYIVHFYWSTDMRLTTTLAAAAAIAVSGVAAHAGGMAETVVPTVMVQKPVATSSINPGFIVLGLLAVLVAVAASEE